MAPKKEMEQQLPVNAEQSAKNNPATEQPKLEGEFHSRKPDIRAEWIALAEKEEAAKASKQEEQKPQEPFVPKKLDEEKINAKLEAFLNNRPKGDTAEKPVDNNAKADKPGEDARQESSTDESALADAEALGVSLEEASKLAPETRKTLIAALGKKEPQVEQAPQFTEIELDDFAGTLDVETMAKVKELVNTKAKDAFEKDLQIKKLQAQIDKATLSSEEQALDSFVNGLAAEKEWEEIFGKGQGAKLKTVAPEKFKARAELWNEMQKQKKLGVELKIALRNAYHILYGDMIGKIASAKDRDKAMKRLDQTLGRPSAISNEAKEAANQVAKKSPGLMQRSLDKLQSFLNSN